MKTPSERENVLTIWKTSFEKISKMNEFPSTILELLMLPPTISNNAIFFTYENPTGEINQIRSLIEKYVFPEVKSQLGETLFNQLEARIPTIIHSTFARYKGRSPNEKKLRDQLTNLFTTWEPITFHSNSISLAIEYLPYMHIPYDETTRSFEIILENQNK